MEETRKIKIKIDPLDFHPGLKDAMAEFESLIRMTPGESLAKKIADQLNRRFCHCCFFGHVEGEICGEPLCKECAKMLYGFDENDERPGIKDIDPRVQMWYRKQRSLPIFEAYLHAELERWKLESQFGWRSWKLDPPKERPETEGCGFCGHQKYDYEKEMRYFVDVGHLDVDGTLCMFNDWDEGEQTFEIDYWFPLPRHPDEPKKETKEEE